MEKTLRAIGNSYGIIIEKPILELLKIDKETKLSITTDGTSLIISPIRKTHHDQVISAAHDLMDQHDETFRKLAQ